MTHREPPYVCLDCLRRVWRNDEPCPGCGGRMLAHVRAVEIKLGQDWRQILETERAEEEDSSGRPAGT